MMTPEELTALLALAEEGHRASPGEWVCHDEYVSSQSDLVGRMSCGATARYIAAACNAVPELVERLRVAEWMIEFLQQHNGAFMCPAVVKTDWCQHPERIATGDLYRHCSDLKNIGAACWIECGKRQARAALNLPEEGEQT